MSKTYTALLTNKGLLSKLRATRKYIYTSIINCFNVLIFSQEVTKAKGSWRTGGILPDGSITLRYIKQR